MIFFDAVFRARLGVAFIGPNQTRLGFAHVKTAVDLAVSANAAVAIHRLIVNAAVVFGYRNKRSGQDADHHGRGVNDAGFGSVHNNRRHQNQSLDVAPEEVRRATDWCARWVCSGGLAGQGQDDKAGDAKGLHGESKASDQR